MYSNFRLDLKKYSFTLISLIAEEAGIKEDTPPVPEIIWVKNVRAIVVCGFLMK